MILYVLLFIEHIQGLDIFLGLVDSNRNRLASTTYFAIVSSMFSSFVKVLKCKVVGVYGWVR